MPELLAPFVHFRGALDDADLAFLARASRTVTIAVLTRMIDVKSVVRVLERGNRKPTGGNLGHQPFHQAGLARILPPCNTKYPHTQTSKGFGRAAKRAN